WTDHTFVAWYSDSSYTTAFDFDTEITTDITLYAKWAEFIPITYTKMASDYGSDDSWEAWEANYSYVTVSSMIETSTGYKVNISYNIRMMTSNTSSNATEAAAAGSAYYGAFSLNFEDSDGVTVSYGTYSDVDIDEFFGDAYEDSSYIDWWRLYSDTASYSADGKSVTYTFSKEGYEDTTLTVNFNRADEFLDLSFSTFPSGIFTDPEGGTDTSWTTWNSNKNNGYVSTVQEDTFNGYKVTVTYDSSQMATNTSTDETMASTYGSATWAVSGLELDSTDGVTVTVGSTNNALTDVFDGPVTSSQSSTYQGMYWIWWILNSAEDQGSTTYDRNGRTTTLTFSKEGYPNTVVIFSFVDEAE
nr:InlB B-repeat-containing protein [Treponemataceae bacterium]